METRWGCMVAGSLATESRWQLPAHPSVQEQRGQLDQSLFSDPCPPARPGHSEFPQPLRTVPQGGDSGSEVMNLRCYTSKLQEHPCLRRGWQAERSNGRRLLGAFPTLDLEC